MLTNKLKKHNGYIYMDAVLAVFIVGVVCVAMSAMFTQASQASASAAKYSAATNIARQQMELLKQHSVAFWGNPQLPNSLPWQGTQDELTVNSTEFSVTTVINQMDTIDATLVKVTVKVSWQERMSTNYIQLITYFSKV